MGNSINIICPGIVYVKYPCPTELVARVTVSIETMQCVTVWTTLVQQVGRKCYYKSQMLELLETQTRHLTSAISRLLEQTAWYQYELFLHILGYDHEDDVIISRNCLVLSTD